MKEFSVREFGKIALSEISTHSLRCLRQLDSGHIRSKGETIFDWSRAKYLQAKNYVGVVQVPGLRVEILPKIDTPVDSGTPFESNSDRVIAQSNLLYMLALTKKIPVQERDLASLRLQRMPLLEALLRVFVERLLTELRRGLEHAYVRREENIPFVKGKLLLSEHVRKNVARRDFLFVAYDDFISDTGLNRILKAACRRLVWLTSVGRTKQRLSEALLYLAGVSDVTIRPDHFQELSLNRNAARFLELLNFCRIILLDSAVAPAAGTSPTFSLLFPMETLFEEFIGRFVFRHAEEFGLLRSQIHIQAGSRRKWLLRDAENRGRFKMKPDLVIDDDRGTVGLILDTKWKCLKSDAIDAKNGVPQSDMYQLYAYAHRYQSADNVLLFPRVDGVSPKRYRLAEDESKVIRVEFISLNHDLQKDLRRFKAELQSIISPQRVPIAT